jgi:hypothetical protein
MLFDLNEIRKMFSKMPLDFSPTLRITDNTFTSVKAKCPVTVLEINVEGYLKNNKENEEAILTSLREMIAKQESDSFYMIEFAIPSRFSGNHLATSGHAVTAFVDTRNKRIITNDPLYGEIQDSGKGVIFPPELTDILTQTYPDYSITEDTNRLQKKGEIICSWLTYVKIRYYLEYKPLRREHLVQEWLCLLNLLVLTKSMIE